MAKTNMRIGIVGCGVVATGYYLPYLLHETRAEIAAVCDLSADRTEACARLFGAGEQYQDYFRMIDEARLDAVLILTAPGTHARFAIAAAERGIHILIQKPMALTLEDANAITDAVRRHGVKCVVEPSSDSPLDSDWANLRTLVQRGVLGTPYWFSLIPTAGTQYSPMLGGNPYGNKAFFSADSGGVLFDYPYFPTKIVTLLGNCAAIQASARISVPNRRIVPDDGYTAFLQEATDPDNCNYWDEVLDMEKTEDVTMAAPDNVFSTYEMEEGWIGTVHAGRPFHPMLSGTTGGGGLQIFGEGGNLIAGGGYTVSIISNRPDLLPEVSQDGWYHVPVRGDHSKAKWPRPVPGAFNYYAESTRHLIDCVLEDQDPIVNAEWGRHITEMMYGSLVSSNEGRRYVMTTTTTGLKPSAEVTP